jgi:hypothetical protein
MSGSKYSYISSHCRYHSSGEEHTAESARKSYRTFRQPANIHSCQRITEAIQRYYARQVLEPSVRGFLSILEKTFPRNDLYLFELLQNAVDDGAMHVCFYPLVSHPAMHPSGRKALIPSISQGVNSLEVVHNGRNFNAMDCLGLASVGLSTKSSEQAKRTIGSVLVSLTL